MVAGGVRHEEGHHPGDFRRLAHDDFAEPPALPDDCEMAHTSQGGKGLTMLHGRMAERAPLRWTPSGLHAPPQRLRGPCPLLAQPPLTARNTSVAPLPMNSIPIHPTDCDHPAVPGGDRGSPSAASSAGVVQCT